MRARRGRHASYQLHVAPVVVEGAKRTLQIREEAAFQEEQHDALSLLSAAMVGLAAVARTAAAVVVAAE